MVQEETTGAALLRKLNELYIAGLNAAVFESLIGHGRINHMNYTANAVRGVWMIIFRHCEAESPSLCVNKSIPNTELLNARQRTLKSRLLSTCLLALIRFTSTNQCTGCFFQ